MYPVLLLVLGIIILMFGKRLPVLGAAVGALLGVALLHIFEVPVDVVWALGLVLVLTVGGFVLTGLTTSILDAILVVICALAGAEIMVEVLDYFFADHGVMTWLIAIVGGLAGWMVYRFFRKITLLVLAELIGALLVTRGLAEWFPFLHGWPATVTAVVLAGVGIAYQNGYFANRKAAAAAQAQIAAAQAQAAAAQAQAAAAMSTAPSSSPSVAASVSPASVGPGASAPAVPPAPSDDLDSVPPEPVNS